MDPASSPSGRDRLGFLLCVDRRTRCGGAVAAAEPTDRLGAPSLGRARRWGDSVSVMPRPPAAAPAPGSLTLTSAAAGTCYPRDGVLRPIKGSFVEMDTVGVNRSKIPLTTALLAWDSETASPQTFPAVVWSEDLCHKGVPDESGLPANRWIVSFEWWGSTRTCLGRCPFPRGCAQDRLASGRAFRTDETTSRIDWLVIAAPPWSATSASWLARSMVR